MRKLLIGAVLALAALPAWAQDLGALDGTWQGSLGPVDGPGIAKDTKPISIRLIIAGSGAQVFLVKEGGALEEAKPGAFRVARLKSNAVVLAIDSADDSDGTWVETWDFAVTLKDRNTLIANWYRVVNNIDMPPNAEDSKFTAAAAGELTRVQ